MTTQRCKQLLLRKLQCLTAGLVLLTSSMAQENSAPGAAVQASSSCARCHSNSSNALAMRDRNGNEIAPFDLWQSSMMANSAIDPLWRAAVSAEVSGTPSRRDEIESTCLKCHAPMAEVVGLQKHESDSLMHVLDCDSELGDLARDGVSCTICHGMSPEGLGTEASYTANFQLDPERRLFGPHEAPFTMPMRMNTGFTPTYGEHITQSAHCGSCHTLETDTFDAKGELTGHRLIEQAPYLEWLNSSFSDADSAFGVTNCQDCHVPTRAADQSNISTRIAHHPRGGDFGMLQPREPFGRHLFVGGNTLVTSIFRDHGVELGAKASPEAFQATIDATREQLRTKTIKLSMGGVKREGDSLSFHVDVQNLTGHKFPTAHPTRRAWLRVILRDAKGETIFASGAADQKGRLLGSDGDVLPSELQGGPVQPHYDLIQSADQVAGFHALMADAEGQPTHLLLRGASWLRDDRLLPLGWSANHPGAHKTEPRGIEGDENFVAGSDRVHYSIDLGMDSDVQIEVSLLYQTLSARWADEILKWDTPDINRFRSLYAKADKSPEVLSTLRWPN